jgi:hypothetical protein
VSASDVARVTLAGVRLFNGAGSLVAPEAFARRMGAAPGAEGPSVHPWRMFGIRTVLVALDLVSKDPAVRRHALRVALLIHVSDTVSAARAGLAGQVPKKTAVVTTAVSAGNVVLAAVASSGLRKQRG